MRTLPEIIARAAAPILVRYSDGTWRVVTPHGEIVCTTLGEAKAAYRRACDL